LEEKACLHCKKTKNRPKGDLQRLFELSTMSHGSTPRTVYALRSSGSH
jgi:hypothetical protein